MAGATSQEDNIIAIFQNLNHLRIKSEMIAIEIVIDDAADDRRGFLGFFQHEMRITAKIKIAFFDFAFHEVRLNFFAAFIKMVFLGRQEAISVIIDINLGRNAGDTRPY